MHRTGITQNCEMTAERLSCWPSESRTGLGHRQTKSRRGGIAHQIVAIDGLGKNAGQAGLTENAAQSRFGPNSAYCGVGFRFTAGGPKVGRAMIGRYSKRLRDSSNGLQTRPKARNRVAIFLQIAIW